MTASHDKKEHVSAQSVLELFKNQRVFTKVVPAAYGDDTSLNFMLDQFADPVHIRPIKDLDAKAPATKPKANRNRVCDLTTLTWYDRVPNPNRGGPRDTVFIKKTSVSKPPIDGVMNPFADDTYVGFIFEHDDYKSFDSKNDKLVKLPRNSTNGIPKYCFTGNAVTNNRFWIENQYDSKKPTQSVCLDALEKMNASYRQLNQIPPHNEILACPSKDSIRGIYVNKLLHANVRLTAPKLNAIRVRYLVKQRLNIDIPTLIMTPQTGIQEYPIRDQVTDILNGLNADPTMLRFNFAMQILDSCFLAQDEVWSELLINSFSNKYTQKMIAIYRAILKSIYACDSADLLNLFTASIDKELIIQKYIEFCATRNIAPILNNQILVSSNLIIVLVTLCKEKKFQAVKFILPFCKNHFKENPSSAHTIASQLIEDQQYNILSSALNLDFITTHISKFPLYNDKTGDNALHLLYKGGKHRNIKPIPDLLLKLSGINLIAIENIDGETPLDIAIKNNDHANAEFILKNFFYMMTAKQLHTTFNQFFINKNFRYVHFWLTKILEYQHINPFLMKPKEKNIIHELTEDFLFFAKLQPNEPVLHQILSQTDFDKKANIETIRSLISLDPLVLRATNRQGLTPIKLACINNFKEVIDYLINHHLDNVDNHGLAEALPFLNSRSIKNILKAKKHLNINHQKQNKQYLVHTVIDEKPIDIELIRILCEPDRNINLHVLNNKGQSLLDIAFENKEWALLELFITDYLNRFHHNHVLKLLQSFTKIDPDTETIDSILQSAPKHLFLGYHNNTVNYSEDRVLDTLVKDKKPNLDTIKKAIKLNGNQIAALYKPNTNILNLALQQQHWEIAYYFLSNFSNDFTNLPSTLFLIAELRGTFYHPLLDQITVKVCESISHLKTKVSFPFETVIRNKDFKLCKEILPQIKNSGGHQLKSVKDCMNLLAQEEKVPPMERIKQIKQSLTINLIAQCEYTMTKSLYAININYIKQVISQSNDPNAILELMNAADREASIITSRISKKLSLNIWNNAPASTAAVELIQFIKNKLIDLAKINIRFYNDKTRLNILFFLSKPTRKGLFSQNEPPEVKIFSALCATHPIPIKQPLVGLTK